MNCLQCGKHTGSEFDPFCSDECFENYILDRENCECRNDFKIPACAGKGEEAK